MAFPPARFEALQLVRVIPPRWCNSAPPQAPRPSAGTGRDHAPSGPACGCGDLLRAARRLSEPFRACGPRHASPRDWREQVDRLVMHPVWGYAVLVLVFLGIFQLIFTVGKFGEDRILGVFNALIAAMSRHMDPHSMLLAASKGRAAGNGGRRGHCSALFAALPGLPRRARGPRIPLASGLPDGRAHAPAGPAWHGHAARASRIRVQRPGGDGDAHPQFPARPLYRRVLSRSWCPARRA